MRLAQYQIAGVLVVAALAIFWLGFRSPDESHTPCDVMRQDADTSSLDELEVATNDNGGLIGVGSDASVVVVAVCSRDSGPLDVRIRTSHAEVEPVGGFVQTDGGRSLHNIYFARPADGAVVFTMNGRDIGTGELKESVARPAACPYEDQQIRPVNCGFFDVLEWSTGISTNETRLETAQLEIDAIRGARGGIVGSYLLRSSIDGHGILVVEIAVERPSTKPLELRIRMVEQGVDGATEAASARIVLE